MNRLIAFSLLVGFSSLSHSFEDDMELSNRGEVYWESVQCGEIKADLIINHRTVSEPTLYMAETPIKLENGPNYHGPVCVTFRGEKKVGFVESMGNAYEIYRIVDLDTFEVTEITYAQADKIGFND